MDVRACIWIACVASIFFINAVYAVDPHYLEKAKILNKQEADLASESNEKFEASARSCKRVGERAAKKRVSCIADTDFFESLSNRVHMSRIVPNVNDKELWDLAFKISKCSIMYSKYFEKACTLRTVYLNDRRRCNRLRSRQLRAECKGEIQRKYHRRG
ncbi:uncharacterized protein LOC132730467 [Ruditapes philippinarum]|uniref:uncharacterized protein LOC132730467 n=1 Tax=Ruditapes philippinarum TaxID=129788 RepID=UPI00295BDD70|nr:uncharacterized protein LOC132730467 [Ruditapes philippinarum]